MDRFIAQALEIYDESPQSKDSSGARIPHPLDYVDDEDKLFALDISLKDVALKTIPVTLLESGGASSELKRVSRDYYVRVPLYPQKGANLDIDDGLAYAVIFLALAQLWDGFGKYEQKSEMICNVYNNAYRSTISEILDGSVSTTSPAYIRFSADGQEWHESYQDGDIYISFKRIDTDTWTPAIRFVGMDGTPCSDTEFTQLRDTPASYAGAGGKIVAVKQGEDGVEFVDPPPGSGAVKFTDLEDTPADYTGSEGKFVSVADDGSGLVFSDPPAGSGGGFDDRLDDSMYDASGTVTLKLYDQSDKSRFYFEPTGDLTIAVESNADGEVAYPGRIYVFEIAPNGYSVTFDDSISVVGDASIDQSAGVVLLVLFYDGIDFLVVAKNVY